MTNATQPLKKYFDIHTTGIGFLKRCRVVDAKSGRKAQSFLACTIAALVGPRNDPKYRYIDLKVSGADAKVFVERYVGKPDSNTLVRFKSGDLWVDSFIRSEGPSAGQPGANLKGRLLKVAPMDRSELSKSDYHELLTRGIGYLSRLEDVDSPHGDPFLACTIGALTGDSEEAEYRYFESIVTHADASHLVRRCADAVKAEQKVLMSFRLNDLRTEPYIRTKGDRAGTPGASLHANLVHVSLIKIDGEQVYPLGHSTDAPTGASTDAPASEVIPAQQVDAQSSPKAAGQAKAAEMHASVDEDDLIPI